MVLASEDCLHLVQPMVKEQSSFISERELGGTS